MENDIKTSKIALVEDWIDTISYLVQPDSVSDFRSCLLEGILEEDSDKIDKACDELSNSDTEILRSEMLNLKNILAKKSIKQEIDGPIEQEIDQFLQAQGESKNVELRERMVSKLRSGAKSSLISYVKEHVIRKKITKFLEFIEKFETLPDDLILKSSQPCQDTIEKIDYNGVIHDEKAGKMPLDSDKKLTSYDRLIEEKEPLDQEEKIADISSMQTRKKVREEGKEVKLSDPSREASFKSDLLEKIKSTPKEKRKVWIIYETYEDTSSEYRMRKIRLQEQEYEDFISGLKVKNLQVRGYYGGLKRCLRLAEKYLGEKFFETQGELSLRNEAIIALSNGEKACLLFVTHDAFYDFERKADPNALAINYIRILIDLSQVICISPPKNFRLNPDNQNPYIDKPNPGFTIKEERIEPSDKVSIIQVPILPTRKNLVQDFDFSKFVFSSDFTKNLVKAEVKVKAQSEGSSYQAIESQVYWGYMPASALKGRNYSELKKELLGNYPPQQSYLRKNNNNRRAVEEFLKEILIKFIPEEKKVEFQERLKVLVDDYLKKKDGFQQEYTTQIEMIYDGFCQFILRNKCEKEEKTYLSMMMDIVTPDGNILPVQNIVQHQGCLNYKVGQLNKNFKYRKILVKKIEEKLRRNNFNLHSPTERDLESMLSQMNRELGQTEDAYKDEQPKKLADCRKDFLQKVFCMADPLVMSNKAANLMYVQLNFYNVNILRGVKDSENFNVTSQPVTLVHNLSEDLPSAPHVRSLYFIQDNTGLAVISDFPPNKSSLYSFNISNKGDPRIESFMTLSSSDAHLLVEPNFMLWCIFDNKEQRFNMGKLSSIGKPEGGAPVDVFNEIREGCTISQILSACFLPFSDSFYIINQDSDLFELKYHSKSLSLVSRKENHGESYVRKSRISPTNPDDKYLEIQTTSDGKNIILRSRKGLDIYDLTWKRVHSIIIDDGNFVKFKTFVDDNNHFLIIFKTDETICYRLAGLSATKTLKTELTGLTNRVSNGNPIFDYLYLAFRQFGPHSSFIGSPSQTKFAFLNLDGHNEEAIERYFKSLRISETSLEIYDKESELLESSYLKRKVQEIDISRFKMILFTRVPLHVATIENYTLIPLRNGENISDKIAAHIYGEKSHDLIEKLTKLIEFGVYEKLLASSEHQISVVSIVGRQSSGKSYVMNREFGTRFNVASERCTDGIWISMTEMKSDEGWKLFVVLDCEGLFSARRNDQEEIKLCLTLAAISDVMILNQDLSFNRHFNRLFNNFSNAIGRLKGRKLFKGYLMMLIRDVKSEAAEGAYKELQSNIAQVTRQDKNFLTSLFQGELKSQCLNYFEKEVFNAEVEEIREKYFNSLKGGRWETGIDFLESFKITLAQVYMDDDSNMDTHKFRITCERRFKEAIDMFYDGGNGFEGENSVFLNNFDFNGETFTVEIYQKSIALNQSDAEIWAEISEEKKENDDSEKKEENSVAEDIIREFENQTIGYSQEIHNIWFKNMNICIEKFLEKRISYVLHYFESKMPNDANFKEIISSSSLELKTKFNTVLKECRSCQKTCRKCARICNRKLNHANNCDCGTKHFCEIQCILTSECTDHSYLCANVFGHEGSHRCNQGSHKCDALCDMAKFGCSYTCTHEIGHSDNITHNCQNKHPCNIKCTDEKCTRTCQFDLTNEHAEHSCGDTRCIHKCSLCDQQCIFKHHLHDKFIKENRKDLLQYEFEGSIYDLSHHSCGNEHACPSKCSQLGVCQIGYNVIEKEWKNSFGSFPYPFFEPKESRQLCKSLIPKFMLEHQDSHDCKIGVHRCSHKCAECKSFCNQDINHSGLHSTNNHRNKENNVFVSNKSKKTIKVTSEGKTRIYAVGELCQPENCTTSCTRKGRAHYHLKECPGGDNCAAKINPYVRHSNERYEPYVDKVFDMWLCSNYWNSMNWEVPVQDAVREELSCCNFVCNHYSHGDKLVFCKNKAWHSDPVHQFECRHDDNFASLIDIVFCCDTTGSMARYINSSKETIKRIVKTAAESSKTKERNVQFAFVAYRDHPPEDKTYVTKVQNLCSEKEILEFIETLDARGGGDPPEAVLDGIFDSIYKTSWRKTSLRYIFHIADAPAHGIQYSGVLEDHFPKGCPCGIKIEDLAASIHEKNIKYKLLKIGSWVNRMALVFKQNIEGYEESDLNSDLELPDVINKIIARDITTEEQDVLVKGDKN